MARKKVRLAWIVNDSTRRMTLRKRKKGLMKKVQEISILCDVKACAVVYDPHDQQPEIWPASPGVTKHMLEHFKSKPECEQTRKMVNQETFLQQRVAKMTRQLHRLTMDNREAEMRALVLEGLAGRGFEDVGLEDATGVIALIESKMKEIGEKIEEERKKLARQQHSMTEMMSSWPEVLYVDPNTPWHDPFFHFSDE